MSGQYNNQQLFRNLISNSALPIFMDIFSGLHSWDESTCLYSYTVSLIILPDFLCYNKQVIRYKYDAKVFKYLFIIL